MSVTYRYFVPGYTNRATTREIRKFSDKLNYLNFPFVKFFNICWGDGFDVNYIFLHHMQSCVFKSQNNFYSFQWEINFFIIIWLDTEVWTGCLSSESTQQ